MTTKVVPGQLVAVSDLDAVTHESSTRIARALREAIARHGSVSFALSGGETPRPTYERLAREPGIDWSKVDVFWIDERAVPPSSDRSNYRWAKSTLLDHAPIPPASVHRMVGEAADLDVAAHDYENVLRASLRTGGFDVAVMGIGDDGHTASLFPGESGLEVADRLVISVPAAPAQKREARLTVTVPVIEACGSVFVLVVGKEKHAPLERAWSASGSTSETPARVMRGVRGSLTWIIDRAAGGIA